ncbi:MAG: hypothetical protein ACLQLT_11260 [Methylovirgula sp.]
MAKPVVAGTRRQAGALHDVARPSPPQADTAFGAQRHSHSKEHSKTEPRETRQRDVKQLRDRREIRESKKSARSCLPHAQKRCGACRTSTRAHDLAGAEDASQHQMLHSIEADRAACDGVAYACYVLAVDPRKVFVPLGAGPLVGSIGAGRSSCRRPG